MKKAEIYCRVSTNKQENNGDSLNNQEKACREYCKNNNIQVIGVFKEAFTGKSSSRPIFNEAINNAIANKVDYFIVFDIDRFSREGYSAYYQLKEKLLKNNIELRDSKNIIGENKLVINNELVDMKQYKWNIENTSEYAEVMMATQAQIEGKKIIQRTIPREIELEQQGYQVRASNYGYMNKKISTNSGKKTIQIPHPAEGKWLKEMFIERSKGYLTDKQIVENINLKGGMKRDNKPMSVKYMQELMRKPVYAGVISTKWTGNKPIRTAYTGLIDIKIWNKANRGKTKIIEIDSKEVIIEYKNKKNLITEKPILEKRKNYNIEYPFAKVLKCPVCSSELTPNSSRSGDGSLHYYYQCRGKGGVKHKNYTIKRELAHNRIDEIISTININDDLLGMYDEICNEVFQERENELTNNKITFQEKIEELDNKEKEILKQIDNVINFPKILEIKNRELEDIEKLKADYEIKRNSISDSTNLGKFKHYSKNIITHIEKLALQKEKPELITLAFDIIYDGKIEYKNLNYHTSFFNSFSSNLRHQKNPQNGDFSSDFKWQDGVTYRPTNLYRYFIYEVEKYREINEKLEKVPMCFI